MKATTSLALIPALLLVAGCAYTEPQAWYDNPLYSPTGAIANDQLSPDQPDANGPRYSIDTLGGSISPSGEGSVYEADRGMQTRERTVADPGLESEIRQSLLEDSSLADLVPTLQISVVNGTVVVAGWVPSEQQKNDITLRVRQIPGVTGVRNHVQISTGTGPENSGMTAISPAGQSRPTLTPTGRTNDFNNAATSGPPGSTNQWNGGSPSPTGISTNGPP